MNKVFNSIFTCCAFVLFCFGSGKSSFAQNIPPPPELKIPLAAKDKLYFTCTVWNVNYDSNARLGGSSDTNLWTKFMKGGKFEALSDDRIRVVSSSLEDAKKETYDFYQRYAEAAFIRGPTYNKGKSPIDRVVKICEPEIGRTAVVDIKSVSSGSFRLVEKDKDHVLLFLSLYKPVLTDEALVEIFTNEIMPSDAFTKRDKVGTIASSIKKDIASIKQGQIAITGKLNLGHYNFDKGLFMLSSLDKDVTSYEYSMSRPPIHNGKLPRYDLIVSQSLFAYKPASIEEAKKIEAAISAGTITLRTYFQPTGAAIERDRPTIKGTVSHIEALSDKGTVLFRHTVK